MFYNNNYITIYNNNYSYSKSYFEREVYSFKFDILLRLIVFFEYTVIFINPFQPYSVEFKNVALSIP